MIIIKLNLRYKVIKILKGNSYGTAGKGHHKCIKATWQKQQCHEVQSLGSLRLSYHGHKVSFKHLKKKIN